MSSKEISAILPHEHILFTKDESNIHYFLPAITLS